MFAEPLSDEKRIAIETAPANITNRQLAADLGLHENTIYRHRKKAKEARAEAARTVLVERVSSETPNALAALSDCLKVSHAQMMIVKEPDYVRACITSAKTLLDYLGLTPEPDELDEIANETLIDEVRRRLGPGTI